MEDQNRSLHEMDKSFAAIRLEEEEEGGLSYAGVMEESLSEIDMRWCLVGKFLTDSPIDFQAMQHKMASLWRPGRGVYVKALESNRFIFQFYHEVDIKRVIDGSPWTFGRFQLVFKRLSEGDDPRLVMINKLDLWVQLHGMGPGFMSQRVVQDICNYIGEYVDSDENNFIGVWRDYLRVRVAIPLDKPLKRRMKIKKSEENWCWVNFRYEGIPTFCFICGFMGHNEKFCEKIFDVPLEKIEKPYGIWMKAEPRRKNHTIGAKWLRQGNQTPMNNPMPEMETRVEEGGSVIVAGDRKDPKKVGDKVVIFGNNRTQGGREKIGGDFAEIGANKIITARQISNSNQEGDVIMDCGLLIVDPKRRRVEDIESIGPSQQNIQEDVTMMEKNNIESQNQKNEIMAGAAEQARLGL